MAVLPRDDMSLDGIVTFVNNVPNTRQNRVAMDLQELHRRTGISSRRLRYCVDHKLVPELHIDLTPGEAGRPRRFHDDVGFGIVCAAVLLDIGLPHERIRWLLAGLLEIKVGKKGPRKPALVTILEQPVGARACLSDEGMIRIEVPEYDYDSGWIVPGSQAKRDNRHKPRGYVVLDLGRIRDQVFFGGS